MAAALGLDEVAGRLPADLLIAVDTGGAALDASTVAVSDVHHDFCTYPFTVALYTLQANLQPIVLSAL